MMVGQCVSPQPGEVSSIPMEVALLQQLSEVGGHSGIIRMLDWFEVKGRGWSVRLSARICLTSSQREKRCSNASRSGSSLLLLLSLSDVILLASVELNVSFFHRFFRQIVEALQFIHAHDVVHGDIKDENIVVDMRTLDVKIIDFGSGARSLCPRLLCPHLLCCLLLCSLLLVACVLIYSTPPLSRPFSLCPRLLVSSSFISLSPGSSGTRVYSPPEWIHSQSLSPSGLWACCSLTWFAATSRLRATRTSSGPRPISQDECQKVNGVLPQLRFLVCVHSLWVVL